MTSRVGDRALVLGSGIAGLLAARTLADFFGEVLVLDRDELPDSAGYRRGVPHGRHAHGIMAKGQQILEQQFPGLTDEMIAAGVKAGDFNGGNRWYIDGKRLAPSISGLLCVPATRPVLEHHVRERVRKLANVTILDRHDILGFEATPDRRRVVGVRVRSRAEGDAEKTIPADLLLDITGRGSRTPRWLWELGYDRPPEDKVKIGLAYTTRHYRLRTDPLGDDLAIIPAPTPTSPRGAFLYRLPGDPGRYELSLTGMLGDHPPTDPEGFVAFAKSLPVPDIYQAIRDAEPLDDPVSFSYPASVRRRYERLTRFPERLLVMGDALCSFNPIYAQGMTVAAIESVVLRRQLERGMPDPQTFFREMAPEVDLAWDFSAGADLGFPGVEGNRTLKIRMANAYVARLQKAAVRDPALTNAFIRAAGMVDPPQALMRPGTVLRVLRHSIR
ncbi:FAD-binding monooxygenase [Micromonospora sp. NPDC048999]|uniref:FAD-dependent oxidoreductase n=1 Tax=Micromonospora sp. NPDC048999 TaxID=3155391 RepID=UPI0033FA089C